MAALARGRGTVGRAAQRNPARLDFSRYRDNPVRHLIGISRDLVSRMTLSLGEERGYEGLRPSLGPFLSLVWTEGQPLAAIASQLAISRQACSQLANLAEDGGYLERQPDPADRRVKLVRLTAKGQRLVGDAVEAILQTDAEYAALVGKTAYRRFTASLAALRQGLEIPTTIDDPTVTTATRRSIGVLPLISLRIGQDLMAATHSRGHKGLKPSHWQLLPLVGSDGVRMHELARIQRQSRQAISATARDLDTLGYLRREPDPDDRRGVVLQLTKRGTKLIGDSVIAVDELERRFGAILGARRFELLRETAGALYAGLHLEEEQLGPSADRPTSAATMSRTPGDRGAMEDIEQLAATLRRRLGSRGTERLVELLASDPPAKPRARGPSSTSNASTR